MYADSTNKYSDIIVTNGLADNTGYAIEKSEQGLTIDNLTERSTRQWIYISLIVVVSSLLIAFIIYRFRKVIKHQITKRQWTLQSNKKLHKECNSKDEELHERDKTITKLQSENMESHRRYEDKIADLQAHINNRAYLDLSQTPFYVKFIKGEYNRAHFTDEDIKIVEMFLDEYSDQFAKRLRQKAPYLSTDNYLTCLFIRFGFSVSQIASFFYITDDAVRARRRRMKDIFDVKDQQSITEAIKQF